jgi:predicted membrane-bound spermidine synthase
MVHIHMPTRGNASGPDQRSGIGRGRTIPATVPREVQISPSWRHFVQHFLEMFAAMWGGMVAGTAVFLVITGQSSLRQAALLYPVAAVVGMALSMTVPMVGWMLHRATDGGTRPRWPPRCWCPRSRS